LQPTAATHVTQWHPELPTVSTEEPEVEVPNCVFVEKGGSLDDYDDDDFTSAFDFGYCLTVHKSQGSEWDKVLLIDENHKHERRRWLYAGLTRAAKSIIVQG
jgi:ATP-dependent exoDNAse (exonuclease V) alpha subunit